MFLTASEPWISITRTILLAALATACGGSGAASTTTPQSGASGGGGATSVDEAGGSGTAGAASAGGNQAAEGGAASGGAGEWGVAGGIPEGGAGGAEEHGGAGDWGGAPSGGASASSGVGGGSALLCSPFSTIPCYSGAPTTKGVGICTAGLRVCAADGSSYGDCSGEVLPQTEDCAVPLDENCDGVAASCTGSYWFSGRFGDAQDQSASQVILDSSNSIFFAGEYKGIVDFEGDSLASTGTDAYVVARTSSGDARWAKSLGGPYDDGATGVAVTASGEVLVTGYFEDTMTDGSGTLASEGGIDGFLTKLDANGDVVWSHGFGGPDSDYGSALALDSSGNVLLVALFGDSIEIAGNSLSGTGSRNLLLASFDPNGNLNFAKAFDGDPQFYIGSLAVDPSGSILLAGDYSGIVDFGAGAIVGTGTLNSFVAKFDKDGTNVWSKSFGATGGALTFTHMATDPSSNVLLAGGFSATAISYGGAALLNVSSTSTYDIFVAKLDSEGNHIWSQSYGSTSSDLAYGVASDPFGNILLTGQFGDAISFGSFSKTTTETNGFVLKLDPSGTELWAKQLGNGADEQLGTSIATDTLGRPVFVGWFAGIMNVGAAASTKLTSAGGSDIFLGAVLP